jgi:hypothetical protein
MAEAFVGVDCDAGKTWGFADEEVAVRYAAARYRHGNVCEVIWSTTDGEERIAALPPDAPLERR